MSQTRHLTALLTAGVEGYSLLSKGVASLHWTTAAAIAGELA
jgi:hypothetical protein